MNIEIINYEEKFAPDFKRLNLEWLDKYHLTESHDLEILDDPRGFILDNEGVIYLARADREIVGAAALMKKEEGVYELVKMAVTAAWQGRGISRMLLDKCLGTARVWKVKKITLFSNSQLQTAIKLYEKYGFRYVKVEDSPFASADISMELIL